VSREIIGRCHADLISINRLSQQTEPGLAQSWKTFPGSAQTSHSSFVKEFGFQMGIPSTPMTWCFLSRFNLDEAVNSPQRTC